MSDLEQKEKELMDHLEAVVHRYVIGPQHPGKDICRKAEVTMVEILGKCGCMIMTELADRASLSMSTATGLVDGLVEKGLAKRERSDEDRRIVRVELTEEGRKIYEQAQEVRLRMVRGMLGALDQEEQEAFVKLFHKIVEKIEKEKKATVA